MIETLFGVVVLAAVLGVAVWFSKRQGAMALAAGARLSGVDPRALSRMMLERTGFQHAAMLGAPLDAQVEHSMRLAAQGAHPLHLIRAADGFELHFEQHAAQTPSGAVAMSARWWTPARPRLGLHLVERRFAGLGQAVINAATSLSRSFTPRFAHEVALDPELAQRFRAWSNDPAAAQSVLAQPSLRAALTALRSVELVIDAGAVALDDPMMENLTGGGPAHAMLTMGAEGLLAAQVSGHAAAANLIRAALAVACG